MATQFHIKPGSLPQMHQLTEKHKIKGPDGVVNEVLKMLPAPF
jgi:hypothetical protein